MPDLFIVRARARGWDIFRLPHGGSRQTIVRDVATWPEVERVVHQTANDLNGYAWPESRTPNTDVFSLRTEPESTWLLQRD